MANFVTPSETFEKKAKKLIRKYPTFGESLLLLEEQLVENPALGKRLGRNVYKVRLSDKSKGGGKSGGFRVITYLVNQNQNSTEVILLTIYDKSDQDTIDNEEIGDIIDEVLIERKHATNKANKPVQKSTNKS